MNLGCDLSTDVIASD